MLLSTVSGIIEAEKTADIGMNEWTESNAKVTLKWS